MPLHERDSKADAALSESPLGGQHGLLSQHTAEMRQCGGNCAAPFLAQWQILVWLQALPWPPSSPVQGSRLLSMPEVLDGGPRRRTLCPRWARRPGGAPSWRASRRSWKRARRPPCTTTTGEAQLRLLSAPAQSCTARSPHARLRSCRAGLRPGYVTPTIVPSPDMGDLENS